MDSNSTAKFNGYLKVKIINCTNVPNIERYGLVDPYVNLTLNGSF